MEPVGPRGRVADPLRPARAVVIVAGPGAAAWPERIEHHAKQAAIEWLPFDSQPELVVWLGGRPAFGGVAPLARTAAMAAFRRALSADGWSQSAREPAMGVACVWGPADHAADAAPPPDVQVALQTVGTSVGYTLRDSRPPGGVGDRRPRAGVLPIAEAEAETQSAIEPLPLVLPHLATRLIERAVTSTADEATAPAADYATRFVAAIANDLRDQIEQLARAGWSVEPCRYDAPHSWCTLWRGAGDSPSKVEAPGAAVLVGDEHCEAVGGKPAAILPGSFNPLHAAHLSMRETAAEWLSCPVDFELSLINVDKPPLDFVEAARRAAQFAGRARLWLTTAPTFREKAALFPGTTFVVGLDTVLRIGDERYYGGDRRARDLALEALARHGCRFLVFGRRLAQGFRVLDEVVVPRPLASLCESVPAERFRLDLSSSEIRAAERARPS